MNSQLSERIRQKSGEFSKGQRAIARYIEEHSDKVAFMTASKLGATVGVSESTVVRFATEIGYSGYPALQQAMQEMIRSKMTSVQRLEMTSSNVPQEKLLDVVLDQDIDILKRTKESVDRGGLLPGGRGPGERPEGLRAGGGGARWPWPPFWPTTCGSSSTRCTW